ncbi:MAG: ABC transporter substrate-binding protein, partial [Anaerolineae bacterium]|nr:ABC transporter substrate-binding protein [Anaerolineae bacterium]
MSAESYPHSLEAPVSEAPERVVSLVPSITESLFDLNLGKRLVGRTSYCIFPIGQVDHIPAVGGTKYPDIDQIIALKPNLVFANMEENRKQDVDALQATGIPVWVSFPKTVQDVFNLLWNIMYLFDETAMVPRIRLIEQTYDRLLGVAESRIEPLPRVFVPIWYDPLMTANSETYLHDVLRVCGGENVFADRERQFPLQADLGQREPIPADSSRIKGRDTRYPRVTTEEVVVAQPEVILLPSEPFLFTDAHVKIFRELDIPAAKNNRIYLVDGT